MNRAEIETRRRLTAEKGAEVLRQALMDLHQPKVTSAGVRCSECGAWRGGRLVRAPWPCRTAQVLGVSNDPPRYGAGRGFN